MVERPRLDAVRNRREALYEAVIGLEDALATPIGDGPRWRIRVAMAIDHAANRIEEHTTQSERGLLDGLADEAPGLARRIDQLKVDHERLGKEVDALRVTISVLDDDDIPHRAPEIRNQAIELLGQMTRHRQRGADLIYDAYEVDIGDGH